ncbi:MAG: type II toxin-antitoxin system Phd/YefM family antitoxin [Capsulimonas sp.]|uniref:type II toxin-antitoxin system Phd/YefM family antitoxin n=1 Tax=Capsulimonas sp. TaxID=2494211 RepID=UPI003266EBD1
MLNLSRDIHSLTDFKRNTSEYVKQMKETKDPVVLTVNGKAELVVQDAESYQALLEVVDRIQTIEGIRRGLEQMAQGQGVSAADAFAAMRQKFNISNE